MMENFRNFWQRFVYGNPALADPFSDVIEASQRLDQAAAEVRAQIRAMEIAARKNQRAAERLLSFLEEQKEHLEETKQRLPINGSNGKGKHH